MVFAVGWKHLLSYGSSSLTSLVSCYLFVYQSRNGLTVSNMLVFIHFSISLPQNQQFKDVAIDFSYNSVAQVRELYSRPPPPSAGPLGEVMELANGSVDGGGSGGGGCGGHVFCFCLFGGMLLMCVCLCVHVLYVCSC